MTTDVSRLAIVVESTGIKEARNALDGGNGNGGLYGAATKAEKAVSNLTATVAKLINVNASGATAAWATSMAQLNSVVAMLNQNMSALSTSLNAMPNSFKVLQQSTNSATNGIREFNSHSGVMLNTVKAMTAAALTYMSVNAAKSIIEQADAWQLMQSRLAIATGSMENAKVAQQQMFDLSQRLRAPLGESVKLYTRLAPAVQKMGKDSSYARDMVEGVATALKLGGANGAEMSSVMLQLSQSFGSGVLNGAEFNAVAENGTVIMRALTAYTGKSTAELKKMGSQGKLSMETVGAAIEAALPMWRQQFDSLPLTFEGAMTRLKSAWTKAVGQMGEDTHFNQQLSQALRGIENMLPGIAKELGKAFLSVSQWVVENQEGLEKIYDQLKLIVGLVGQVASDFFSWIADISGAGGAVEGFAKVLAGVRITMAAIADGVVTLGRPFVQLGLIIYEIFVGGFIQARTKLADYEYALAQVVATWGNFQKMIGNEKGYESSVALVKTLVGSINEAATAQEKYNKTVSAVSAAIKGRRDANGEELSYLTEALGASERLTAEKKARLEMDKEEAALHPAKMDEDKWNANKNVKPPVDAKAEAAEAARLKRYQTAYGTLTDQIEAQRELAANLAKSGLDFDKITPAQKEVIKLQREYNALVLEGADKKKQAAAMILLIQAQEASALSTMNEQTMERLKVQKAVVDNEQTKLNTLKEEAAKLEAQVATYGQLKGAATDYAAEALKARIAMLDMTSDGQRTPDLEKTIGILRDQLAVMGQISDAQDAIGQNKAFDSFNKIFDDRKAEKFGSVLAEGFGKAGKAAGQLMNAIDKMQARNAKLAAGKKEMDKLDKNSADFAKASAKYAEEDAQAKLASYADLAGAAKGFFEEGSKGYKAMQAAEMTFRAFQMAMQVKSFLQESGFLTAITALFVSSKATEVVATESTVAPTLAANIIKQGSNAVTALTSALAGPWPMNLVAFASVAAILATLGVAVFGGGGGGGVSSAERQEKQGTGTVMGDDKAKSESISKSLDMLSKNSDIALRYSSGMLSSLQNIEYSLTGATSGVIRSGSVTGKDFESTKTFSNFFDALKILGGIFGSKTTLQDSGLVGSNQSVGNILQSGFNVKGYQDTQTSHKFLGITYSSSNNTSTSAIDPSISREFGNVINGMVDSLSSAAAALGMDGDAVRKKLEAMNIDIGKISLKGLSSDEIQKQLEAVFSAIGDKLATAALPSMLRFQHAGEGLLETAVRVASGVEKANYELDKLGINAVGLADVVQTNGDIGAEIVRQSILVVEAGSTVADIIKTVSGEAADIADTYKSLLKARQSLQAMSIAKDVSVDLIKAAGGLDALQSALDSYQDNFFSDAEKQAMKVSALGKEFAKLGLAMPNTKEGFRALVEQLSGSGNETLATKVLLLADSFAQLSDTTEQLVSSARDDLSSAYERESDALKDTKQKFEDFAKSLMDFKSSLLTGDLSTLNVAQKYQVEKQKFEEVLAKALGGDQDAIGSFQDVASSFLQASRDMNASGGSYSADFQRVLDMTDAISALATTKATEAQQQLDLLTQQVNGLITINQSVLSVTDAIIALTTLLGGGSTVPTGPTSTILPVDPTANIQGIPAYQSGTTTTDATAALTAQVAELTAEVAALRADQAQQTSQMIAANHDSNMQNAEVIVGGVADTAAQQSYEERAQPFLD